jgi:hypothetical protein
MLDNNNNEILDGSETFIENRIKGYIQSGCKVTILQDKTVNENRKIVLITRKSFISQCSRRSTIA